MKINLKYKDLKHGILHVLGLVNAKRELTILPDDTFVVSFPKSGNTWTRFLIANILFGDRQNVDFKNIEKLVPDIYQANDSTLLKIKTPRVLKSHEFFDPRYKQVIYIVRDPRDVAVSQYFFHNKTCRNDENFPIDDFVDMFISGGTSRFGTWGENVGSWLGFKKDNLWVFRYEDLLLNGVSSIKRMAEIFDKHFSEEKIKDILAKSSFDNMRKLEEQQGKEWKPIKNTRSDIPFMRSGKIGQWKNHLSEESVKKIWNSWSAQMEQLGYEFDY